MFFIDFGREGTDVSGTRFIVSLLIVASLFVYLIITIINTVGRFNDNKFKHIALQKMDNRIIYSKDWLLNRDSTYNPVYLDLLVDSSNLYILKHEGKNSLLDASIAVRGFLYAYLINYKKQRMQNKARSTWYDSKNNVIISDEYKKYTMLTMSLDELKSKVFQKSNTLRFDGDKKIYIGSSRKKVNDFLSHFHVMSSGL